ncbi:MAG: hypothetical protein QF856_05590 [Candidatus Marinimicrobia bacterium]|nr:hypothetical protein [Candidatus Neomarinimicrobiota bacterium]
MRLSVVLAIIFAFACQTQNKSDEKAKIASEPTVQPVQAEKSVPSQSQSNLTVENEPCNAEVCLQLRNHNPSNKSFEIYMVNNVSVAGFQCDLPGINITSADGGLLKENGYQTSNSASRIISFSMQKTLIPIGEGVLTTIYYSDPTTEVCMTEIIFASADATKLDNEIPDCMSLN